MNNKNVSLKGGSYGTYIPFDDKNVMISLFWDQSQKFTDHN